MKPKQTRTHRAAEKKYPEDSLYNDILQRGFLAGAAFQKREDIKAVRKFCAWMPFTMEQTIKAINSRAKERVGKVK